MKALPLILLLETLGTPINPHSDSKVLLLGKYGIMRLLVCKMAKKIFGKSVLKVVIKISRFNKQLGLVQVEFTCRCC